MLLRQSLGHVCLTISTIPINFGLFTLKRDQTLSRKSWGFPGCSGGPNQFHTPFRRGCTRVFRT